MTAQAPDTPWLLHGGVDNIRYSPLTHINRDTVAKLQVAWTYDSRDACKGSVMQSNAVVVDVDKLYQEDTDKAQWQAAFVTLP